MTIYVRVHFFLNVFSRFCQVALLSLPVALSGALRLLPRGVILTLPGHVSPPASFLCFFSAVARLSVSFRFRVAAMFDARVRRDETVLGVAFFKRYGQDHAEVGCLAIHRDYRKVRGNHLVK